MQRLVALRAQLKDEIAAEAGGRYRDVAGEVTDIGDESIGAEIIGTDNAVIGRHVEEVRDIEAALKRIDDGIYGRCIDCGADVDEARLRAWPTALRCEPCQAVHEKTFAAGGHPSL
ncbi:MAG TPA: TraR/DksA family transcriptional regulator [Burkholderiaceae bacterium]|nr:TraR/DksA family transcriptional regulator [Burkholderiaceae bacterium]